jgi:hypothetical protein
MSKVNVDQIVSPEQAIHPCLDWVKGQLIVGVNLRAGATAVLSSVQGLVSLDGLGPICPQGKAFNGAVSRTVADQFVKYLETRPEGMLEDGRKLLDDLAAYLKRFIVFPKPWFPEVLASWILGTYVFPVFQTYPYLWISSPAPGCGKSLLGGIMAKLSFNGEFMVAPTEAQLFHLAESSRGVQVWDEVENSEEVDKKRFNLMRPVLLNGYRNGGAAPRQVGKNFERSARYHVFCPRVLIGLTKLPETALQRTIQVRLEKRSLNQKCELYIGAKYSDEERQLRERCLLWALQTADQVNRCYQDDGLRSDLEELLGSGRLSDDIWLPLLGVASAATAADQDFLGSLKRAAKELSTTTRTEIVQPQSPAVARNEHVAKKDEKAIALQTALNRMEYSGPVTPRQLAKDVSQVSGREVTTQRLSKDLAKIGIRAKKKKGCRIFVTTPPERESARRKLSGQQGQEDMSSGAIEARV